MTVFISWGIRLKNNFIINILHTYNKYMELSSYIHNCMALQMQILTLTYLEADFYQITKLVNRLYLTVLLTFVK